MAWKQWLKRWFDYDFYDIYSLTSSEYKLTQWINKNYEIRVINQQDIEYLHADLYHLRGFYNLGNDVLGYGMWYKQHIIGVVWYAWGKTYQAKRGFITLKPNEIKLIEIAIASDFRQQQLAYQLLCYSSQQQLHPDGKIIARLWHSHHVAHRLFQQAQWQYDYSKVVLKPKFMTRTGSVCFKRQVRSIHRNACI